MLKDLWNIFVTILKPRSSIKGKQSRNLITLKLFKLLQATMASNQMNNSDNMNSEQLSALYRLVQSNPSMFSSAASEAVANVTRPTMPIASTSRSIPFESQMMPGNIPVFNYQFSKNTEEMLDKAWEEAKEKMSQIMANDYIEKIRYLEMVKHSIQARPEQPAEPSAPIVSQETHKRKRRVADDSERCTQSTNQNTRCPNRKRPNQNFCGTHFNAMQAKRVKAESIAAEAEFLN